MSVKPTYKELEKRIRELEQAESERKRVQTALRESEERYRELVHFSPLPFLVTREEKIFFANPAAVKLFGAGTRDEMIGTSPKEWLHPGFVEQAHRRRRQATETGEPLDPVELVLVNKNKEEIYYNRGKSRGK